MSDVDGLGDESSAAAEKYVGNGDSSREMDRGGSAPSTEQPGAVGTASDRHADDGQGPADRRPGSPRQLPPVPAFFVSRGAELADLDALMDLHGHESGSRASVAVVVGPGGVGKTALAVMWANRHAERFPDGQLYVDLRGFSPDTTVAPPVDALGLFLRALGVEPRQVPATLAEQVSLYRTITAGRQLLMLVVLDNAASAEQVRPLIPTSTRSVVVVTSRLRLDGLFADGAALVEVPPLPEAAAVALLEKVIGERARDETDATAELAQLCGLFPIALRVAAARLVTRPMWSVSEVVARLRDERSRLVALSRLSTPEDSVTALFDWPTATCNRMRLTCTAVWVRSLRPSSGSTWRPRCPGWPSMRWPWRCRSWSTRACSTRSPSTGTASTTWSGYTRAPNLMRTGSRSFPALPRGTCGK